MESPSTAAVSHRKPASGGTSSDSCRPQEHGITDTPIFPPLHSKYFSHHPVLNPSLTTKELFFFGGGGCGGRFCETVAKSNYYLHVSLSVRLDQLDPNWMNFSKIYTADFYKNPPRKLILFKMCKKKDILQENIDLF